jgi:hypothetical protein
MKKIITLLLFEHTLTACAPNADEPASLDPSYPNASYPNPSYPNSLIQNDYAPQPSDTSMIHGTVFLDSTELLTLESFRCNLCCISQAACPPLQPTTRGCQPT